MNCSHYSGEDHFQLVGDPVNVVTGANLDRNLDFTLTGPLPLEWHRYYNSAEKHSLRQLGWGHGHEYDRRLLFDADGLSYITPTGKMIGFPPLVKDGDQFARSGVKIRRLTLSTYRVLEHGKPAMEFAFENSIPFAILKRVVRGRAGIAFYYGSDGHLEGIIDSAGRSIAVEHDQAGRLLTLILLRKPPENDRCFFAFGYDHAGNLIECVDPYGHPFSFTYDQDNRMVSKTDRRGYSFYFEYDQQGRCIHSYGEDGLFEVQLRYLTAERLTIVTQANGGQWQYFYNEARTLTKIVDPYGGAREFKLDKSGRPIEETEPNGNLTRLVYDSSGALIGKRSSSGQFSAIPEDPRVPGPRERTIPTRPIQWEYGNLYARLRSGEEISLPAPDDVSLRHLPNHVRKQVRTRELQFANDSVATVSPAPVKGSVYDDFGKLVSEPGPNGRSRRWLYDPNGNVYRVTDRDGSRYTYGHASWNLRTNSINPLGEAITFRYTKTRQLAAMRDRGGTESEYEYDLKDRLIRIRRHGVVKEEYRYDNSDNLIEKLDGNGNPLVSIQIGPGNLKVGRRLASGQNHSFDYDKTGRLLRAATDDAEVLFAYDRYGNRTKDERNGVGVTHRYSGARQMVETTYFNHFKVLYNRSPDGSLRILDPRGLEHKIEALGHGLFLRTAPNGSSELAQFDDTGRCLLKATSLRRRGDVWSRRYSYSGEGDLLEAADNVRGTVRYTVDLAHRLIRADLPDGQAHLFSHDGAGNLLGQPGLLGVMIRDGNRLAAANGDLFAYNERNHVSSRVGQSGENLYFYDSMDMLIRCEIGNVPWSAEYDALARRVSKTASGKRTSFYWDRDRIVAEVHQEAGVRLYIYADEFAFTPLLFVEYESLDDDPESGRGYNIYSNHLATPLLVEDDSGSAVWEAHVDPYGFAKVEPKSKLEMPLRFPGHYFDPETGLHYNRFRYYSPELGRYLQSDPIGISGGPSLYAYTANPLKRVDVLGLTNGECGDGGNKGTPPPAQEPADEKEGNESNEEEPASAPGGQGQPDRGDLTPEEIAKLQALADSTAATINVVGSAAAGERRQIGNYDLPLGKDPPDAPGTTRSDIDVMISSEDSLDGGHTADAIRDAFPNDVDRVLVGDPNPGKPVTTFTPQPAAGGGDFDDEPTNPGFRRPGA